MRANWEALRAGGVPLRGERAVIVPSPAQLAEAALEAIDAAEITEREREALAAWLCAWQSHWPTSFRDSMAGREEDALAWATRETDADRHLKLRRIAIERLAAIL